MEAIKNIVLFICLSSLIFSAQAICVARNHDHVAPKSSPVPKISTLSSPPNVPTAPKANHPPPQPAAPKAPVVSIPKAPVAAPKAPVVSIPKAPVAAPRAPVVSIPKAPVSVQKAPVAAPKVASGSNAELNRLCGLTENPALCVEATTPYLEGGSISFDPIGILKAAMKAANNTLGLAISEAKKFASDPKTDAKVKSCISTCVENYESAVDDIEKSFTAIDENDIGSLNSNLDAALTMVGTCEDTFDENPGVESPMQNTDSKLSLMVDNCLAIRNAVKYQLSPPIVVW